VQHRSHRLGQGVAGRETGQMTGVEHGVRNRVDQQGHQGDPNQGAVERPRGSHQHDGQRQVEGTHVADQMLVVGGQQRDPGVTRKGKTLVEGPGRRKGPNPDQRLGRGEDQQADAQQNSYRNDRSSGWSGSILITVSI